MRDALVETIAAYLTFATVVAFGVGVWWLADWAGFWGLTWQSWALIIVLSFVANVWLSYCGRKAKK